MKLNEALKVRADARALPVGKRLVLACGFQPLHLATFLEAHFAARFAGWRLAVEPGRYADLEGNVGRALEATADVVAIVLEWSDLDPRLGLRSIGAWSGPKYDEILRDISDRLERLLAVIERITAYRPVAICAPSIPFTLAGWTPGTQHSGFELALEQAVAAFLQRVARSPRGLVVHSGRLAAMSPIAERHDPRMELAAGFPYRLAHASVLAELLLELLFPPAPKKGLITDLDDTLWAGVVGEVGIDQIAWTQADGAQLHGLYQLVLRQLADFGVLLGAVSKNDPDIARDALARQDLWLPGATLFPVHASWGRKSEAVGAILRSWNIAAEDVVFVDDQPMELAEVQQAHPGIACLLFPRSDPARALRLFELLRDLFGRPVVSRDDALRGASIRAAAAFDADNVNAADPATFLRSLRGIVSFRRNRAVDAQRALQLLNKTNQFNLNGERVTDQELLRLRELEHGVLLEAAYSDRYGPLGTVGVVLGQLEADYLTVRQWVLSCRAFSRHIEHHMLHALMQLAGDRGVRLAYRRTARNAPLTLFLKELGLRLDDAGPLVLAPDAVSALCAGFCVHETTGAIDG